VTAAIRTSNFATIADPIPNNVNLVFIVNVSLLRFVPIRARLAGQSEKPTLVRGPIILRSPKALISLIN